MTFEPSISCIIIDLLLCQIDKHEFVVPKSIPKQRLFIILIFKNNR